MIELTGDIISLAWYDARPPLNVTEVKLKSTIQNSIGKRKLEKEVQNNESTWMHKSQKASFCRMSASLQSKQAIVLSACQLSSNGSIRLRAVNFFQFSIRTAAHCFKYCFEPGQYHLVRAFQHGFASRRNPDWQCADFVPSRRMPNYFQNSDHQYRIIIDWCLRWKYYVFLCLSMAMALIAKPAPPQRITV